MGSKDQIKPSTMDQNDCVAFLAANIPAMSQAVVDGGVSQALTTLVSTFLTFAPLLFPVSAAPPAAFHVYETNKQNSSCCAEIMFGIS